ncbi:MAG TPA: hypothetical protein VF898_01975 [Chloroflexota bacterium]
MDLFALVPAFGMTSDPVLMHLDMLLDDDRVFQTVRADLARLDHPPDTPIPGVERIFAQIGPGTQHRLRPAQQPADHPHPIGQETAVRRMMDSRLPNLRFSSFLYVILRMRSPELWRRLETGDAVSQTLPSQRE